jgi:hypothetical protein
MAESLTTRTRSTREQRGWYWYDWANTSIELFDPRSGFRVSRSVPCGDAVRA